MKIHHSLLSTIFVAMPLFAEPFPNDECAVIVASRQTLDEVRAYINDNITDKRYISVYPSQNGWYAISVGKLKPNLADTVMANWKASGKIPNDSFCSNGDKFADAIAWQAPTSQSLTTRKDLSTKDFSRLENHDLTPADLRGYSKQQLRLLRNYLFAKKGFAFKPASDLDVYFEQFSWYRPDPELSAAEIYDNVFSLREKNNVTLLLAIEKNQPLPTPIKTAITNTAANVVSETAEKSIPKPPTQPKIRKPFDLSKQPEATQQQFRHIRDTIFKPACDKNQGQKQRCQETLTRFRAWAASKGRLAIYQMSYDLTADSVDELHHLADDYGKKWGLWDN